MTTTRAEVSFSDIVSEIEKATLQADDRPNHWFAVRVATDGSVYTSEEVSECYSEAEYYGREPHTVTVWTSRGGQQSSPSNGFRYWEPCDPAEAEFWTDGGDSYAMEPDDKHTQPHQLGGIVDFDIDDHTAAGIREEIEACGWLELV